MKCVFLKIVNREVITKRAFLDHFNFMIRYVCKRLMETILTKGILFSEPNFD